MLSDLLSRFGKKKSSPSSRSSRGPEFEVETPVLVNGGVAVLTAMLNIVRPHEIWFAAYLGAFDANTAEPGELNSTRNFQLSQDSQRR